MIKKITYIATDGKEFDTKEDCRNYENTIDNPFNGFTFFDSDRNIVDKNQSISNLLNESRYFYVDNNLNVEKLLFNLQRIQQYNSLFDDFNRVPIKFFYGLWFYDNDEWISYNTLKTYYDDLERELIGKINN